MRKTKSSRQHTTNQFSGQQIAGLFLLFLLVISTAFGLVYVKHVARDYYYQIQLQQRLMHTLRVEHNQLLLEESTWGAPARIQAMAQLHFGMRMPSTDNLVMVVV